MQHRFDLPVGDDHQRSIAGEKAGTDTKAPAMPNMDEMMRKGRYIQQDAKGEMMDRPLSGLGFTGFDNLNKKFVSFWIDNMSTAMYNSEGGFDQAGKVLTTFGKMDEPMTGEHDKNVMYVWRIVNPDKFVFEVHDLAIGEPNTKVVEVAYARKK